MELEDLTGFDETLSDKMYKQPTENLQIFEEAAKEVADEITAPRPETEEEVQDIQILLQSKAIPVNIRDLKVSLFENAMKQIKLLTIFLNDSVGVCVALGETCWHHYCCVQCQSKGNHNVHSMSVVQRSHPSFEN